MASDLNKVFLVGRLTKSPEFRHTNGGTAVVNFSVAVNYTYTVGGEKKESVSFIRCLAWAGMADVMAKYCNKGDRIGIDGRLQQRSWENEKGKQSVTEVIVENFQFLTAPRDDSPKNESVLLFDEIPF